MKKNLLFIGLFWLLSFHIIYTDPIITFFFREYPSEHMENYVLNKIKKPNNIAKKTIEGILHHNATAGIFSSYFGFLNVSDQNGQTIFPRKQSNRSLQLVITSKITPIIMFQFTISHWELVPGAPTAIYLCEQKDDPVTQLTFWEIKQEPIPENRHIASQNSLIIIANPTNILVPTGITLTSPGANLILPDMYVRKSIHTTRNALYVLNLSLFFRPADLLYKKAKTNYETLVAE